MTAGLARAAPQGAFEPLPDTGVEAPSIRAFDVFRLPP